MLRLIRIIFLGACSLNVKFRQQREDRNLPGLGAVQTSLLTLLLTLTYPGLQEILKGTISKELYLPSCKLLSSTAVKMNFVLSGQSYKLFSFEIMPEYELSYNLVPSI